MHKMPDFFTAYGPRSLDSSLDTGREGGAKQSDKDSCDVNRIVAQFSRTGEFSHLNLRTPVFGDVTGLEFREMLDFIGHAQEQFDGLPAGVRKRFGNDAREFVDFCSDPGNIEELASMGLATIRESVDGSVQGVEAVERDGQSGGESGSVAVREDPAASGGQGAGRGGARDSAEGARVRRRSGDPAAVSKPGRGR